MDDNHGFCLYILPYGIVLKKDNHPTSKICQLSPQNQCDCLLLHINYFVPSIPNKPTSVLISLGRQLNKAHAMAEGMANSILLAMLKYLENVRLKRIYMVLYDRV